MSHRKPTTTTRNAMMSTNENDKKQTKVEDLPEQDLTAESASEVKGGIGVTAAPTVINPGAIIPCVRTIRTGGL
jgi:hypothetical protein